MIKKLTCMMLLSVIFILPLANGNIISIEPVISHVQPQQNFSINISLNLQEGANGVQCDILFNSSLLHVNSIENGGLFQQWWDVLLEIDNENGTIKNIIAFNFGKNVSYNGTFAVVYFKPIGEGTSFINLSNVVIPNVTSNDTVRAIPREMVNGSVVIDSTPPETFIVGHPRGIGNSSNVSFEWTGEDNGTETENLTYSYRLNSSWSDWTFSTNKLYENLSDGLYIFKVKAKDEAGNIDVTPATFSFIIDTKSPEIKYLLNPYQPDGKNGWYTSNVDVNITANDSGTGINYTMYNIDGSWQKYGEPFTLSNNGSYLIKFYSVDNAGNKNESSFTVKIDKEKPSTNIILSGEKEGNYYTSGVDVSFDAHDSFSGIEETKYRINGGTWNVYDKKFSLEEDGNYIIEYYSIDKAGNEGERKEYAFTIQKEAKPMADFSFSPLNPKRGEEVHFYDASVGTITTWFWNFGDGTTSNEREPSHTYEKIGTYDVTLTVSGPSGMDSKTQKITISNEIPKVFFEYFPKNPFQGRMINFTDLSTDDETIVNYTWNFGDGNVSYEQNPTHKYDKSGTYTVKLTVKDNDGAINETTLPIFVSPLPDLVIINANFSDGMVFAKIRNNGSIVASNFSCSLFVDDKFLNETLISALSPDKETYCNFSFSAEGKHKIIVAVDANNKIKEINEGNNEKVIFVSISNPFPVNTIFLILLVVVLSVVVLFILKRKSKEGGL